MKCPLGYCEKLHIQILREEKSFHIICVAGKNLGPAYP